MAKKRYIALLRGINVGGNSKVAMADLRAAFESDGFEDVTTYINSGNVLFSSSEATASINETRLETLLEKQLRMPLVVVLRTEAQLRAVVADAPKGFGSDLKKYYCDAVFLKAPLTSPKAMKIVDLREGVDRAWPGKGVIYFERLAEKRTQSKMSKIVGTPEYKSMTIRSWSTTTKLLALLDK